MEGEEQLAELFALVVVARSPGRSPTSRRHFVPDCRLAGRNNRLVSRPCPADTDGGLSNKVNEMKSMQARVADRLVIKRHRVGEPDRFAEVLEVRGVDGQPPYLVRWSDDGRVGLFLPGSDAFVQDLGPEEGAGS